MRFPQLLNAQTMERVLLPMILDVDVPHWVQ